MSDHWLGIEDHELEEFAWPRQKMCKINYGFSPFERLCSVFLAKCRKYRNGFINNLRIENDLHIGIVNKKDLNASVSKKNSKYYILIPIGSMIAMYNLFCYVYGDNFTPAKFKFSKDGRPDFYNSGQLLDMPKEPDAQKSISWMWHQSCMFLFFHEFAHYKNGHIDFWSSKYGPGCQDLPFEERVLDRHTLEYDADIVATRMAFDAAFGDPVGPLAAKRISDLLTQLLKFPALPLELTVPSCGHIILLFQIFDKKWSHEGLLNELYPSSMVRMFHCMSLCVELAEAKRLDVHAYGEAIAYLGIGVPDLMARILHYMPPSTTVSQRMYGPEGKQYLEKIHRNWAKIRPLLTDLKKGDELARPQF